MIYEGVGAQSLHCCTVVSQTSALPLGHGGLTGPHGASRGHFPEWRIVFRGGGTSGTHPLPANGPVCQPACQGGARELGLDVPRAAAAAFLDDPLHISAYIFERCLSECLRPVVKHDYLRGGMHSRNILYAETPTRHIHVNVTPY